MNPPTQASTKSEPRDKTKLRKPGTRHRQSVSFLEKEVGSLEAGKKADFIILDQDIMKVAENAIQQVKVNATYLGGKKVH